jgi:Fic family protein
MQSQTPAGEAAARGTRVDVPPVGRERHHWSALSSVGYTRRERAGTGTYYSAVPAEIADLRLDLPAGLVADSEEAAAEIARFDASSEHTLGAITAVLLRSESSSSSQIEQITANARAIAEAELTGLGTGNAVGIVDNMRAMADAVDRGDAVTIDGIAEIQRTLLERHSPGLVGWRSEPVWVGGRGSTPVTADFIGPDHRRIAAALHDLVAFAGRDDLAVLPQIAIAHAQFETIHPFADGNGRTGRALVHLMLRTKQLARTATVPISGGLLVGKDGYFEALGAYRDGDAAPVIDEFNHAALRAVHHGRQLVARMQALRDTWRVTLTARSDSSAWKIIDLLPAHPVIDAETVARHTGTHVNSVRRSVAPLVEAGILISSQHYKSHKQLYRAPAVLELLDDYAAEVGRRQR